MQGLTRLAYCTVSNRKTLRITTLRKNSLASWRIGPSCCMPAANWNEDQNTGSCLRKGEGNTTTNRHRHSDIIELWCERGWVVSSVKRKKGMQRTGNFFALSLFSILTKSKPEVNEHDKAILDLKVSRDKLKNYQKKMQIVIDREVSCVLTPDRDG